MTDHRLSDDEFAAQLAATLNSIHEGGLTLLLKEQDMDIVADHIERHIKFPVLAHGNGRTMHFQTIREDFRPGSKAFHNSKTGHIWFTNAQARGRWTRILRPS